MGNNNIFALPSEDYRYEHHFPEKRDSHTCYVTHRNEKGTWVTLRYVIITLNETPNNVYYKMKTLAEAARDHYKNMKKIEDFNDMVVNFMEENGIPMDKVWYGNKEEAE